MLEWVAISFSNAWKWKVKAKLLSHLRLAPNSGTVAYQAPQSMGFSRQEYWSGLPLPSPSHLERSLNLLGFPGGSDGNESACNVGEPGLIPELGRSPGEGNGYPLKYSWVLKVRYWSILTWRTPWTEEFGGLNPWGLKELDTTEWLILLLSNSLIYVRLLHILN